MKKIWFLLVLLPGLIHAEPLEYFLPKGDLYNATLPSPDVYLGQDLGDRHLRHDQLVSYFKFLAAGSANAQLVQYGETNEGRPLLLLAISSKSNIDNLDQVKKDKNTLKIWNGFSVHGDESSGSNASVLYAWYLLATNNPEVKKYLENTVVLIDPSFNPDGLARFTTHVNNSRSVTTVKDPNDISHKERWPTGRTNHYWFDLNRDWLLLTQTESKARVAMFQDWHPHVLTDHHEMGASSSFFFQPGVPSRKNPKITAENQMLTAKIAEHHAKALDAVGQTYYSKESFDDFYPGKGSTYPDLQGSIGILFEQSTANGGVMNTSNGERSLATGVRNQFLTALSTVKGADANRRAILDYQNNFFKNAQAQAAKSNAAGYLVDVSDNAYRGKQLLEFLKSHQIEVKNLAVNKSVAGKSFKKNQAFYLSLNQKQTTLLQSFFSADTSFNDNTFYDVSSWHLGMAWGLPFTSTNSAVEGNDDFSALNVKNQYKKGALNYVFDWHSGNAAAALHYLMQLNVPVRISSKPLHVDGVKVPAGSFLIEGNAQSEDQLFSTLSTITDAFSVKWYPVSTALAQSGIDLGSSNVQQVKQPKVMMVVGEGIDAYQAGSIWHLFDTQVYLPLTKVYSHQLSRIDFNDYSHIILPSGNYKNSLNKNTQAALKTWVKQGGTLIGLQKGAQFIEQLQTSKEDKKDTPDEEKATVTRLSYADYDKNQAERVLGGAIVAADADLTHPLAFGTKNNTQYALMKGSSVLKASDNPFATPLQITEKVRAAGFVSDHWQEKLKNKPLVVAEKSGRGQFIKFGFNPNFRAFWKGTQQWLINSIFQSKLIRNTTLSKDAEEDGHHH